MKVLFSGSLNVETGGPAMSTSLAMLGLVQQGVDVRIFMNNKENGCTLRTDKIPVIWSKKNYDERTGFPWNVIAKDSFVEDCDIVHAQGVWDYYVRATAKYAQKNKKPYLISLRGMLYPQALKKSSMKKSLFMKLFVNDVLAHANCIHATCDEEMIHYRNLGFKNPVTIIPNPIDITPEIEAYKKTFDENIFRIGYLGRLHKRKNVEGLIKSMSYLNKKYKNIELVVIGGGDDLYEKELKELASKLNVENVRFCGFLNGKEKETVLDSLSLLVMPSEFENFGNVILEGLARRIPCIATKGSPWETLEEYDCGWWIDFDQSKLDAAIEKAVKCEKHRLLEMGENGFRLLKDKYSKEIIGQQFLQTYKWILGQEKKPVFVHE